jgi:hypothetical protein
MKQSETVLFVCIYQNVHYTVLYSVQYTFVRYFVFNRLLGRCWNILTEQVYTESATEFFLFFEVLANRRRRF